MEQLGVLVEEKVAVYNLGKHICPVCDHEMVRFANIIEDDRSPHNGSSQANQPSRGIIGWFCPQCIVNNRKVE